MNTGKKKKMKLYLLFTLLVPLNMLAINKENKEQAPFRYFSQPGVKQDQYLHETFFKEKRGGTFIDIGAHDGVTYSNTYFFEKYLGWTGICIEPMPEIFKQLKQNRKCICVNGCIAEFNGTRKFMQVSGPSNMLSGLIEFCDNRHLTRIYREVAQLGGEITILDMQCFRLNDLLKTHAIPHVDLLSVDVEGAEFAILQSIDFSTVDIDVICVENNNDTSDVRVLLEKAGYSFVIKLVYSDDIYKKIRL